MPAFLSYRTAFRDFGYGSGAAISFVLFLLIVPLLADLVSGSLGAGTQYPLKLGAALLATIPVAIVFVTFQRYFVRDVNEGAERG